MNNGATPTAPADAAAPIPEQPTASAATAAAPSRSAGLRGLVHGLIAFGQGLIRTLQASPAGGVLANITWRFGTRDIALIVARITRGLMMAANLDTRLVRSATRLDSPPVRQVAAQAAGSTPRRAPPARVSPLTQQDDDAALLARLPTAEEIAARLRGKSIGHVLEQICQDLGLTCDHPLWAAMQEALLFNGGNFMRIFNATWRRLNAGYDPSVDLSELTLYPYSRPLSFATGTGPP